MTAEIPHTSPDVHEKEQPVDDNARKFVISGPLEQSFIEAHYQTSYNLDIVFLDTEATLANPSLEAKLARKNYTDGSGKSEILDIQKVELEDGSRKTVKLEIDSEGYEDQLTNLGSDDRIIKDRYELVYTQGGRRYLLKYDIHVEGVYGLEVEGIPKETTDSFDPTAFPAELTEVTGDPAYKGREMARTLKKLRSAQE